MRFVQALIGARAADYIAITQAAEEAGFDAVTLSDHVAIPADFEAAYPYTPDGRPQFSPDTEWPDPWVTAAALAAATTRVRFMTNVFVLPARNPFVAAKVVGTAAHLSGGRVAMGIGAGWMREEFDLLGQPFERRGKRMEEMVDVMRKLWSGAPVEHHGEFYDFDTVQMLPAAGPVPVYLGGHSDIALRRAARIGDGWIGVNYFPDDLEPILAKLTDFRREAGTLDRPFEVVTSVLAHATPDMVERLEGLGVTSLLTSAWVAGRQDPLEPGAAVASVLEYGERWIRPLQA